MAGLLRTPRIFVLGSGFQVLGFMVVDGQKPAWP